MVESSAVVNHAQLVRTQDGQVVVPTYDWAKVFDTFKQTALKGVKAQHHLTFSHLKPGVVVVKDSESPAAADLPPIIPPPGLSLERWQYLYDKIREFCLPECQDFVCPYHM